MPLRARRRARRLSLTSLIDVIFLLLLFFMLSSTFSRFSEVELSAAGPADASETQEDREMLFLRLGAESVTLNGRDIEIETLAESVAARLGETEAGTLIISVGSEVDAQLLTDTLVAAKGLPDIPVTVLGGS